MAGKPDRVANLTKLIKRADPDIDDRYAKAEANMAGRTAGLIVTPEAETDAPSLPQKLPISKVKDNPFNARRVYSQEEIEARAKSLKAQGQYVPVNVARDWENPGEFILIDGHYRKRALLFNGETTIDVKIVEGVSSNKDLCLVSRTINVERTEQCMLDDAIAWNELISSGECTESDEIAALFGVSKSTVSKTLKALELPDAVLSIIKAHPKSFSIANTYELTLIYAASSDDALAAKLASQIAEGHLTVRDLIAVKERIGSGSSRKRKESPNIYSVKLQGNEAGAIKVWASGKITAEVVELDEDKRNLIAEKLRRVFESLSFDDNP